MIIAGIVALLSVVVLYLIIYESREVSRLKMRETDLRYDNNELQGRLNTARTDLGFLEKDVEYWQQIVAEYVAPEVLAELVGTLPSLQRGEDTIEIPPPEAEIIWDKKVKKARVKGKTKKKARKAKPAA